MADNHDKNKITSPRATPSNPQAVSPAPTIRPVQRPPASPLGLSGLQSYSSIGTVHQASLGRGRPRGPSAEFRISGNSQPATPMSPGPPAMTIPPRSASIYSSDGSETDEQHATPRTQSYFPTVAQGESRRVSDMRGSGGGAAGSTTGTHTPRHGAHSPGPSANPPNTGSSGYARSQRARHGPGSAGVSRSASRVRLPLPRDQELGDEEDDELEVIDRGEDLIRRRLKERKRAKRERERRLAEGAADEEEAQATGTSAPTSASTEETSFPTPLRSTALSPIRNYAGPVRARAASNPRGVSATGSRDARSSSVGESERGRDHPRAESLLSVPTDEGEVSPIEEQDEEGHEDAGEESDDEEGEDDDDDDEISPDDDEGVTVKDRQDAINIEHPFGLPIWKPALYRKSRSVTRNAENALHSIPSAAAESHLLLGNVFWIVAFGWWLFLVVAFTALLVSGTEMLAGGRGGYGKTLRGLAWYIAWPFGKYVEGEGGPDDESSEGDDDAQDEENAATYGSVNDTPRRALSASTSSSATVRQSSLQPLERLPDEPNTPQSSVGGPTPRRAGVAFAAGVKSPSPTPEENAPLLSKASSTASFRRPVNRRAKKISSLVYWPVFTLIVAPAMLFVCLICWSLVVTIPMAKLTWELVVLLWKRPQEINFRSAPKIPVLSPTNTMSVQEGANGRSDEQPSYILKRARLQAGQAAPTGGPASTVLLCTYRAVGLQYYKYTVGGVNIMFINLLPLVFFAIFDGLVLLPWVEKAHEHGKHVPKFWSLIASPALIFILGLASVIPLSYFIGMAVASISAQSSIGMGAVINATFGSIIEIVLYSVALMQGKGRLVEGSIVGSLLAGVLLLPGMSMCSGALKRKEQKFNAKSAGVTSTMLIMAIIGTLTPTMFYQTYGSFEIHCSGCPQPGGGKNHTGVIDVKDSWECTQCYYEHPEPTTDPFYQTQVKFLMYACASILLLSYLIGLWFSLRTHASQIWQNPQQLMNKDEQLHIPRAHLARIAPSAVMNPILPVHSKPSSIRGTSPRRSISEASPRRGSGPQRAPSESPHRDMTGSSPRPNDLQSPKPARKDIDTSNYAHTGYTPYLQSLDPKSAMEPMHLTAPLTQEDFRRAVHTLATVSALSRERKGKTEEHHSGEEGGGHEAPSWTRGMSAAVLLGCTLLYAAIAEVLVDVVDVVLQGSGVDEKFLGLTLFALVPNTTEFMNAMSFAMNGNIALSMEIGSAYALQVCLLQIPAMVAFSAFYDPSRVGDGVDTFTLIFPRWDVIAIILSIFLLTYTYIEARSNYHRGSILVLSYIVLVMGFYFAPVREGNTAVSGPTGWSAPTSLAALSMSMTKLWA